ncbi:uncharacterized protein VP01_6210g1, partial [Puccinia sorghi]
MTSLPTSIHASANPTTLGQDPPQPANANNNSNQTSKAPGDHCQKRMPAKKKLWGAVNLTHAILVMVETTPFEEFQSLVISACDGHFTGAGSVIKKGLKARPQKGFCYYSNWLDAAFKAGQREIYLNLKMENPAKLGKHAEMEDMFAAQALHDNLIRNSASKQKGNHGDHYKESEEKLDANEWDEET